MNISTNLTCKSLNIEKNKFTYKNNGLTLIYLNSFINCSLMLKRNSKNQMEEETITENVIEEEITTENVIENSTDNATEEENSTDNATEEENSTDNATEEEITTENVIENSTDNISVVNNDSLLSSSLNQNVIETAGDYKI
jgi:maltodextrin utilization protein YvdJ